jgi:hypothetical protein
MLASYMYSTVLNFILFQAFIFWVVDNKFTNNKDVGKVALGRIYGLTGIGLCAEV